MLGDCEKEEGLCWGTVRSVRQGSVGGQLGQSDRCVLGDCEQEEGLSGQSDR